jgi:predicted dehydrogenase
MGQLGVGIIGAGVRGVYCLGLAFTELVHETDFRVVGLFDSNPQRVVEAKLYLENRYEIEGTKQQIHPFKNAIDLIDSPLCDLIIITSHTNQHREAAVYALKSGKKVYLDKPIAVTIDDGIAIIEQERKSNNSLIMGFTRRYEQSWIKAKELLDSGAIGVLQLMEIQSVIPYSRYLQTWHRKRKYSGGSLNDKCSHHFDVFNWMAGEYPTYLSAVGGRSSVFPIDTNAPDSCRECDRDCHYRRDSKKVSDGAFVLQQDSWRQAENEIDKIDTCIYAPGADIVDHALVSIVYPSGVKGSLFFTIFGPDTKDQEKLYLYGEKGKIILNRHKGTVKLYKDWGKSKEIFECQTEEPLESSSHFGADKDLVRTLVQFYHGEAPKVKAADGLKSLEMVLATQDSITNKGVPVQLLLDCR